MGKFVKMRMLDKPSVHKVVKLTVVKNDTVENDKPDGGGDDKMDEGNEMAKGQILQMDSKTDSTSHKDFQLNEEHEQVSTTVGRGKEGDLEEDGKAEQAAFVAAQSPWQKVQK